MELKTASFKVADHFFTVTMPDGDTLWDRMGQYAPFKVDSPSEEPVFNLTLVDSLPEEEKEPFIIVDPEPGMSRIDVYKSGSGLVVEMAPLASIPTVCILHMSGDFEQGKLQCIGEERSRLYSLNNSLMLLYAFSTCSKKTLLMHSSVTVHNGKGYMFLGKSGTGKSTHSRMWLENIPGCELLNDDNPVIRAFDGEVRVYGSPWSGKTPCYRNLDYPVGAIVRIKRAPYNKATRLSLMDSYASVYTSCSSLRALRKIGDSLHEGIAAVAMTAPCFVMECLPDADAAFVCRKAVEDGEYDG